ncbi:MAG: SulP family inorganic anion transporter [Candidatus Obscuribacterales bacterium]
MEKNENGNENIVEPVVAGTKKPLFAHFGNDFLASVVVFIVALPLCMGIAIASGVDPAKGILTGVVGGLVVSILGGSQLQVSGPAAGLAVLVLELIREHGIEKLGVIIFLAGLIQIVAGLCRFAPWFRAVPPAVIHGMLSGIGLLILAAQFHVMVDDTPKGSGIKNLLSIPMSVYKGLNWTSHDGDTTHHIAAAIGVLTIVILALWQRFAVGRMKVLPGSLVAVVVATCVASFLHLTVRYVTIPSNLFAAIALPTPTTLVSIFNWEIFFDALAIAFIAAAETLLTCSALDKMHSGQRTNYDRELVGQGVGNALCGLIGGIPLTGVMVRSGVNLNAGGRTRASAFMHGLWILVFVALFPNILELIPTSALAALLVFTGYKMINWKVFKEIKKYGRSEAVIYVATIILIVGVDLLTGVIAGVIFSVAKLLYIFSRLDIKITEHPERNRTDVSLKGAATFLSLPRLAEAIESVKPTTELHVHLEDVEYIDHACLDTMMGWDKQHRAQGGTLVMDWGTLGTVFKERRGGNRELATLEFRPVHADEVTSDQK